MIKDYLDSFINHEKDLNNLSTTEFKLDRIKELLNLIGNPHENLKAIHVAGSKGKGSTCVFIAHILKEAGYKVGLYTSPHLNDFNERIRILGSPVHANQESIFSDSITNADLSAIVEEIKPFIEQLRETPQWGRLSFFEVYTAIALCYFQKQNVDFVVLETGLGGRLDATNVVSALVSVITPISLEHTQILGDSLVKIAEEKVAIVKGDEKAVVVSLQENSVKEIIKDHCQKINVPLLFIDEKFKWHMGVQNEEGQTFDIISANREYSQLRSSLLGQHQVANAAVAIGVIENLQLLGFNISFEAIYRGIATAFWPGRFEIVGRNPFIVLDGAHNEASCKALVQTIYETFPGKKVNLVLGISSDKNKKVICEQFKNIVNQVVVTKANTPRAGRFRQEELVPLFPKSQCFMTENVSDAVRLVLNQSKEEDVVLIAGSLFVVSEARRILCINSKV